MEWHDNCFKNFYLFCLQWLLVENDLIFSLSCRIYKGTLWRLQEIVNADSLLEKGGTDVEN